MSLTGGSRVRLGRSGPGEEPRACCPPGTGGRSEGGPSPLPPPALPCLLPPLLAGCPPGAAQQGSLLRRGASAEVGSRYSVAEAAVEHVLGPARVPPKMQARTMTLVLRFESSEETITAIRDFVSIALCSDGKCV